MACSTIDDAFLDAVMYALYLRLSDGTDDRLPSTTTEYYRNSLISVGCSVEDFPGGGFRVLLGTRQVAYVSTPCMGPGCVHRIVEPANLALDALSLIRPA